MFIPLILKFQIVLNYKHNKPNIMNIFKMHRIYLHLFKMYSNIM